MEIALLWGEGDQNPKTPEPIDKKFGTSDYVGDDTPHAKTQKECSIGDVVAYA